MGEAAGAHEWTEGQNEDCTGHGIVSPTERKEGLTPAVRPVSLEDTAKRASHNRANTVGFHLLEVPRRAEIAES